jgi:methionyl-tRNA formyltransferase
LRIIEARSLAAAVSGAAPGTILALAGTSDLPAGTGFAVAARDGSVAIVRVQGPGGKAMTAAEYLNGHRDVVGKRLLEATAERG